MSAARSGSQASTLYRPAVFAYVGSVYAFTLSLVVLALHVDGPPQDWPAIGVLTALAAGGVLLRETELISRVRISFLSIILVAAAVIVGPVGAGIVGAVAMLAKVTSGPKVATAFNVAMMSGLGVAGGLVYLAVGGRDIVSADMSAGEVLLHVGLPLVVTDVTQCLLNALLIALVLRVSSGSPIRTRVLSLLTTSGLAYVGYGVIGFLLVVLWIPAKVGWFAGVLVLAPLLVARWAFDQYGEELKAHERTLKALVTAVETKMPHNVGHSERVAQLCEWIAEDVGLTPKEIQDVRTAGMLHDVGLVRVPSRILRSRKVLDDEDLVILADHALGGVELIEEIEFLVGSKEGIAHHHERFDGLGYPLGLAGNDIPLAARIIAVADTFDCLTTDRSHREALSTPDALEAVTHRSGTQFDPRVVGALAKVLGRHDWTPTRHPEDELPQGPALDHDEPEMSDRLAGRPDLRSLIHGAPRVETQHLAGRA
ncbi:HD-GYP domain-containing protein [Phycicoccus sp. Root101]|uniref:HD-GYP domain-containing protein n=1 Tax=Phycicoccus sp. Root101 TaxID=1736421 RepID=UPI0012F9BB9D|nr:HD-GYP domain-containing protein [Phycicoccus sp. Root101]